MTPPPTPGWHPDPESDGPTSALDLPASVDRELLNRYLAACAAMLLVLAGAVVYGVFINDPAPVSRTTEAVGVSAASLDGPLAFTVVDVEVGEFVVVRLSVANVSSAPARFVGALQTLVAGGTSFAIDEAATVTVNGGSVEIPAGAEAQVGVAFDVPPGIAPEVIELHADAASPGVRIPLS